MKIVLPKNELGFQLLNDELEMLIECLNLQNVKTLGVIDFYGQNLNASSQQNYARNIIQKYNV